ncbi:hypothetical protein AVEN_6593-1 [Araneus ventricosus]|uniref:Uncharacterized protein n=1 Tax=Araneus ventricosus TaxID=182803 RepID=A0A4Y2LKK0_ARAVE|nr:hypothetical protein AVEN_6593-1 [Araneus ventricosus]
MIPKKKKPLRGIRYRAVPGILKAIDLSIRTINEIGTVLDILPLPHRWKQVLHNAGDYMKGILTFQTNINAASTAIIWVPVLNSKTL